MSLLSRLAVQAARAYGILSARSTNVSADYLVVAGGGGGGADDGGGGGAGGLLTSTATLSTLNTYSITVGAGGAAVVQSNPGNNGSNSSISGTGLTTITSTGGGGGACRGTNFNGKDGGSGGGGSINAGGTAVGTGGNGTSGQGNNGGISSIASPLYYGGGGGGGSSAAGSNGTGSVGGAGGAGTASSISGSSVTYAGGGGGGVRTGGTAGTGGSGGGGNGALPSGTGGSGTVNTGGGGGGIGYTSANAAGAGGSGIVIISYTSATPKFVGGTITTSGGKQIHTFTSSGTLSPITPITASYLVVAGGGGGGNAIGGGGGAGGLLTSSTTLYSGATYVVTVGAGGAGGTNSSSPALGVTGSSSSMSGTGLTTITTTGGGGGGAGSTVAGLTGGSGGGGSGINGAGGSATSGQGFAGGAGSSGSGNYGAGGGGGSSAVGGTGNTTTAGSGGAGTASSISGTSVTYAGGGGGGTYNGGTAGSGGSGGGGAGSNSAVLAVSGTPNTGGGGGGGFQNSAGTNYNGGAGGSGVVIISYAGSQQFNGGLVTTSGGNTIHTFTSTGALTPLTNNLNNSLRFRSSASAYLNRTPTVAGNRKTYTFSAWVKRGALNGGGSDMCLFNAGTTSPNYDGFRIKSDTISFYQGGAVSVNIESTQVFRDVSAWYHLVLAVDTTQATAANRVKIYVNGNQVTAFGTANYPAQNAEAAINNTLVHNIAAQYANTSSSAFFDGYMTDINFIDGQALEPYYFGNNDANGVWKPIQYKGTYGTNGFYLTFADTSALTTSSNAGLGKDTSGNGNYWTTNNISITSGSTYDAMLDVPTNTSETVANYCTLNPLRYGITYTPTVSEGNLKVAWAADTSVIIGTMNIPSSGKWYWEAVVPTQTYNFLALGVVKNQETSNLNSYLGTVTTGYGVYISNGQKIVAGVLSTYMAVTSQNTVITVAFDADTGTLYIGAGGSWANGSGSTNQTFSSAASIVTGLTGDLSPAFSFNTGNAIVNFGQRPFAYTPPTGYKALNTYNLPTPTILQGNKYMDATLYTGTGVSNTVVNQGQFKPDWVWVKGRSGATDHALYDSVRGTTKQLESNTTTAETTESTGLTAFGTNGFTVGALAQMNTSAATYVGWQWQAGQGTTSSNTSGSITSTVSVNTTAGFSIVTYTGTGANATVGHGLGVAPKMVIVKSRSQSGYNWAVWHTAFVTATDNDYILLDSTGGKGAFGAVAFWNSTVPDNTKFSLGTYVGTNNNTSTYVAYCFAEIAGFSKFGSYTGNGSTNGPFVYTGFRPKFVMIKRTDAADDWVIMDSTRNPYNVIGNELYADLSGAEGTGYQSVDYISNGFKLRSTGARFNASGGTYIYMAFAEHPFKNANAR